MISIVFFDFCIFWREFYHFYLLVYACHLLPVYVGILLDTDEQEQSLFLERRLLGMEL